MTGPAPLLALENVSFRYPLPGGGERTALEGVSLEVGEDETLVVLGAGGAGKTTLAAVLAGLLEPAEGKVVRGDSFGAERDRRLPVGLVTQNPEDTFTSPLVREEMGLALQNLDWDDGRIDRSVDGMLAEIGLEGHGDAPPSTLSGGQNFTQ